MSYRPYYKHGDNAAICDRCGIKVKASTLREEWTGLYVCPSCWETRQPQDFVRGVNDDQSATVIRDEQKDVEVNTSGWLNTKTSIPPGDNDNKL